MRPPLYSFYHVEVATEMLRCQDSVGFKAILGRNIFYTCELWHITSALRYSFIYDDI